MLQQECSQLLLVDLDQLFFFLVAVHLLLLLVHLFLVVHLVIDFLVVHLLHLFAIFIIIFGTIHNLLLV